MKKQDEIKFAKLVLKYHNKEKFYLREIINSDECDINYKRCWYYLEKWSDKGYYDWGVSMDLGWLTTKGEQKLKEMVDNYDD